MANPITWRNVGPVNFAGSNALASSGADSIARGLDTLRSTAMSIAESQERDRAEAADQLTNQFLNRVAAFNDVNNYDTFRQQMLDELSRQSDKALDKGQVLSQLNSLDNRLRSDAMDNVAYQNTMREEAERPQRQSILALAQNGDVEGAKRALQASDIQDQGAMLGQIKTIEDGDYQRARQRLTDDRNDKRLSNQQRVAEIIEQSIENADNPAKAREIALMLADEYNLPSEFTLALPGQVFNRFAEVQGLTPDQMQMVEQTNAQATQDYERWRSVEQERLNRALQQFPVDPEFSFSDQRQITEGDAIQAMLKQAPDNVFWDTEGRAGGQEMVERLKEDVIPYIRQQLGYSKDQEIPGIILMRAVEMNGTDRTWTQILPGADGTTTFDLKQIRKDAIEIARRYKRAMANEQRRTELIEAFEQADQENYEALSRIYGDSVKSFRDANNNLRRLRQSAKNN
ncbi:hypothetical protein [Marisediminitalea sp.]|uniref:hypothetical protein n=1 Tax=Marisediminitalea sp. TaxID=2662268 RepID=UPI003514B435